MRLLYIARGDYPVGDVAEILLTDGAHSARIEAFIQTRACGDFNKDLRTFGIDELRAALAHPARPAGRHPLMLWTTAETG